MQLFRRIRFHMAFLGLHKADTNLRKYLNLRNFALKSRVKRILCILFNYMCLSVNYFCRSASTLTEYTDSFQVSATTSCNFTILLFMVIEMGELFELMDDFEDVVNESEFIIHEKGVRI